MTSFANTTVFRAIAVLHGSYKRVADHGSCGTFVISQAFSKEIAFTIFMCLHDKVDAGYVGLVHPEYTQDFSSPFANFILAGVGVVRPSVFRMRIWMVAVAVSCEIVVRLLQRGCFREKVLDLERAL